MQNMSSTSVKCYKGLGTILGAPDHPRSSASSLRRTLSADMSSKKWLAQNGFSSSSPIKKTASTEQLHVDNNNCNSNDSQPSQLDIWNAIEADRHKAEQKKKQSDVWGSIIVSQKSSPILPAAPYVHPLSKRSGPLAKEALKSAPKAWDRRRVPTATHRHAMQNKNKNKNKNERRWKRKRGRREGRYC
ncbi:hypothetical protein Syun_002414 [Stephania yunnanensis]|uniref:Uncharacterized protein n=1 Tax=Stephania yunnanensis TaxID=152371 RepID=A0AAP0Q8R9_9MAGN